MYAASLLSALAPPPSCQQSPPSRRRIPQLPCHHTQAWFPFKRGSVLSYCLNPTGRILSNTPLPFPAAPCSVPLRPRRRPAPLSRSSRVPKCGAPTPRRRSSAARPSSWRRRRHRPEAAPVRSPAAARRRRRPLRAAHAGSGLEPAQISRPEETAGAPAAVEVEPHWARAAAGQG